VISVTGDGGLKGVTAAMPLRLELVGAETDAIGSVGELRIEPAGRRLDAAGILHLPFFFSMPTMLSGDRRIPAPRAASRDGDRPSKYRRPASPAFPHADRAAAEQQGLRGLGGRIDEDRARRLEDARSRYAVPRAACNRDWPAARRAAPDRRLDQGARDRGALLLAADSCSGVRVQIRLELQEPRGSATRFSISARGLPCTRNGEAMFS